MRASSFPRKILAGALSLALSGTATAVGADARGSAIVPDEFAALMEGQVEYLDVTVLGQRLGMFPVIVRPDTVTFENPQAVIDALLGHGARLDPGARDTLAQVLSSHMTTHESLACGVAVGACGYVGTDNADVILDRQKGVLSLFLRSDWLARKAPDARLHLPSDQTENALVHRQTVLYASGRRFSSLAVTGTGAVGITDGGFIGFDWRMLRQDGNTYRRTDWALRSAYVRQDIARTHYVQAGRMDMRNLSSPLGGNFGLTMQPFGRMEGVRVGTTQAYLNREVAGQGTPVTVILTQPARVDAYRGEELLGSSYLQAGLQNVDTTAFPVGSYPVSLRIVQNGVVSRTETVPFVRQGGNASAITGVQWFAQAGRALYDDASVVYERPHLPVAQAGVRVPVMRGLVAGNSLARVDGRLYDEARIDAWLPVGRYSVNLTAAQLVGSDGARGQSEQLTFGRRINWSVYRYHTTDADCSAHGSQRMRGLSCNTTVTATVSVPVLRGQATLGYTRSSSRSRYVGELDFPTYPLAPGQRHEQETLVASRALSASYARVFSVGRESLASVGLNGYRRDLNGGRRDRGGFVSVTLSRLPARRAHHATRVQSLGAQFSSPTAGASRATLRASETRIWQEDGYRDLGMQASADDRRRFNASVNGRYDSSAGRFSALLSQDSVRGSRNTFSASAGYASAFALSRSGFVLGADAGGTDPAAGVAVTVHGDRDVDGSAAASVTSPSLAPTSLRAGEKRLIVVSPFQKNVIDTRDGASTAKKKGAVHASLETGTGPRPWFLTPGKIGLHSIASRMSLTYIGRLSFADDPMGGSLRVLNAVHADVDESGAFVAEFDHRPDALYTWRNGKAYVCRVDRVVAHGAVSQVEMSPCNAVAAVSLPERARRKLPATLPAVAGAGAVRTSMKGKSP